RRSRSASVPASSPKSQCRPARGYPLASGARPATSLSTTVRGAPPDRTSHEGAHIMAAKKKGTKSGKTPAKKTATNEVELNEGPGALGTETSPPVDASVGEMVPESAKPDVAAAPDSGTPGLEPPATPAFDPAAEVVRLLRELGFERTGDEIEEIRPELLLRAA